MPTVISVIRSTETITIKGDGPDLGALREELLAQIPDSHEAISVLGEGKTGLTLTARPTATRVVRGEGADYDTARAAALAQVPDGWIVLTSRVE